MPYLRRRITELASPKTRSFSDPLAKWSERNIRLDGKPFRFEGHEYLRAIYDDTAAHVVISKAAQVGGTTFGLLRSIHAALNDLSVIYFFPTRTDVLDFSKSRVTPMLQDNAFLSERMSDTDTAGLKRIGDAFLYFRGMQSTVGMKSVPADMLVFDELDEATPEAKSMALERISHSDYKRVIELSNPSLPDYGIDEQYQKSDQRHWTHKCPGCGQWVCLEKEFPQKLNQEIEFILRRDDSSYYYACPECSTELDPEAGEWVADFPEREIHGYRISQLTSPKIDPGEILHEYQTTRFPDRFYNLKIGVPWADLERRLDIMSVLSLCTDQPMKEESKENCVMGVDTGRVLHVVIVEQDPSGESKPHRIIHLGKYHDFAELDQLMERYEIGCCVIDGLPETHATRAFARRHEGWVFLNFFNENQRGDASWNRGSMTVAVNRTEALDASRDAIRKKKILLPRQVPVVEEFARHMSADAKILEENPETGAMKYRYVRTGEDHFSLAFTYAWMAAEASYLDDVPFGLCLVDDDDRLSTLTRP